MLKRLTVENYALIERLDFEPGPSLNIITGETGAGKSILLGALGLLSGARCDTSVLKDAGRNCVVEGDFAIGGYGLEAFFADNDLDYDPLTVIRRIITPAGKSRAYVNDLPVNLTVLRDLSSRLIDIHSQHQNLLLGGDAFKLGVLDGVAGHADLHGEYSETYRALRACEGALRKLREESERNAREEEWLRFQTTQLEEAGLREDEQPELESLRDELTHASEIASTLSFVLERLDGEEQGALPALKAAGQALSRICEWYGRGSELSSRLDSCAIELRDVASELESEAGRIESDPARLEEVCARLDTIYSLQQKHGAADVASLLSLLDEYRRKLDSITSDGDRIIELEEEISSLSDRAHALAARITDGRRGAGEKVSSHVVAMLSELGIADAQFTVGISESERLQPSGNDDVSFLFSANRNSPAQRVEKIASGGEISRVMLALKSLAARSSGLATIIFDEIDSGVSGRVADAMGGIMEELSGSMQVVNITHLPQVAGKGDFHFHVYKKEDDRGGVHTSIRLLTPEERVAEIAKMLSGSTTTQAATDQARFLLGL